MDSCHVVSTSRHLTWCRLPLLSGNPSPLSMDRHHVGGLESLLVESGNFDAIEAAAGRLSIYGVPIVLLRGPLGGADDDALRSLRGNITEFMNVETQEYKILIYIQMTHSKQQQEAENRKSVEHVTKNLLKNRLHLLSKETEWQNSKMWNS